jgi:hypothetical protein
MEELDAAEVEERLMKSVKWHRMWLAILRSVLFAVLIPELMLASSSLVGSSSKLPESGAAKLYDTAMPLPVRQSPFSQSMYEVLSLLCNPDLWCFVLVTYLLWFPMRSPTHTWNSLRATAMDIVRAPFRSRVLSANLGTLATLCWLSVGWRLFSTVSVRLNGTRDMSGAVLHPSFWLRIKDDNARLRIPGTNVPPFIIVDVVVPLVLAAIGYRARSLLQLKVGRTE